MENEQRESEEKCKAMMEELEHTQQARYLHFSGLTREKYGIYRSQQCSRTTVPPCVRIISREPRLFRRDVRLHSQVHSILLIEDEKLCREGKMHILMASWVATNSKLSESACSDTGVLIAEKMPKRRRRERCGG